MTLKAQIMPHKVIYLALLFMGFAYVMKDPELSSGGVSLFSPDNLKSLANDKSLIFLALGIAVIALDGIFPAKHRDRLVHLRWNDPMPGSRAFSQTVKSDTRINITNLKSRYGRFPRKAAEQNRLFYKLYQSVSKSASIQSGHKSYLLTRDLATMTYVLLVPAIAMACFPALRKAEALTILVCGLLLAMIFSIAAKSHSRRFVANVLAVASEDHEK